MSFFNSVLLVDDDPTVIYLNQRVINKLEITDNIKIASNGHEAIKAITTENNFTEKRSRLILLDINMPVMDGFDFMKAFNNLELNYRTNTMVVVLSTSDNTMDKQKMEALGVKYYLKKPLKNDSLNGILSASQGI